MRSRPRPVETHGTTAHGTTARITYVGHATVLVELDGVRLLTDPVLRTRVAHLRRHGLPPETPADIDAVLLSHLHHDHLDLPSLRRLPGRPRVIAPIGAGPLLRRAGFAADEVRAGDSAEVGAVRIRAVPAVHSPRRWPVGGPTGVPLGFVIGNSLSVYFAGDTDLFPEMASLAPLDLALVPVAGWGPQLGPGHLDPSRAARAVALLQPRVVIPIHWGTLYPFLTRRGDWFTTPAHDFAAQVAVVAPDSDVRVLRPGESTSVAA
jgi:L-ascorbate metabolism protein UlaG (beta-lactamase superfamily)